MIVLSESYSRRSSRNPISITSTPEETNLSKILAIFSFPNFQSFKYPPSRKVQSSNKRFLFAILFYQCPFQIYNPSTNPVINTIICKWTHTLFTLYYSTNRLSNYLCHIIDHFVCHTRVDADPEGIVQDKFRCF